MTVLTSLLLGLAITFASTQAFAQSEQGTTDLLAQTKKKPTKKRPNKKKKSDVQLQDEAFGPDDIQAIDSSEGDMGSGIHREQEGVDTPYKAEINLRTNLSFLSVEVGDADPYQNTVIDIGVEWLFLVSSLEVGPDISYSSSTTATTVQATDTTNTTTTEVSEVSNSSWAAGGMIKWNFANVDKSTLVPFAYAGLAYRASESKVKDADAIKSSGSVIRVGGGMNMFIDSNVAFNPRAEFRMETDKDDDDKNAIETKTSGFKLLVGIAVFI